MMNESLIFRLEHFHRGYNSAVKVKDFLANFDAPERDFRKWMEEQTEYPIATNDNGVWWCECYADFQPSLDWRYKRLKAEARAMSRQKKQRDRHYPQEQLELFEGLATANVV